MGGYTSRRVSLAPLETHLGAYHFLPPRSHDRAFLDAVATDIVHQHSQRLDYYKGNFTQFYATKSERSKNLKKEYETQLAYRQHLQVCMAS
jgi:ATPase subunit of ABC transporter with duplicated ATPase domains